MPMTGDAPREGKPRTMMGTVDRALGLLRHFSVQTPEFGLSDLARKAGYDKTTTLRCMTALERNGFVEQHPTTKKYRLGFAPIALARIRERSFPIQSVLKPHLDRLAATTGETAHATLLSGRSLMTVAISEPDRATRVHVDPSAQLPIHATASGLAIAAFMPEEQLPSLGLSGPLRRFTDRTPASAEDLKPWLEECRRRGYSRVDQAYEIDVIGTAVPIFGWSDAPIGAIAVAAAASRFDAALADRIVAELLAIGREASREMGGNPDAGGADAA